MVDAVLGGGLADQVLKDQVPKNQLLEGHHKRLGEGYRMGMAREEEAVAGQDVDTVAEPERPAAGAQRIELELRPGPTAIVPFLVF